MIRALLPVLLALPGLPALSGDPVAGEAAANLCVECHGVAGAEPIANYPIIAGQHEDYLLQSMRSYKDDSRSNAVMVQLMAEISDEELANLAAYFAAQPSPLR